MSAKGKKALLANGDATGDAVTVPSGRHSFRAVSANWGGGSVVLESLGPDGTTWIPIDGSTLSVNGEKVVDIPGGQYRAAVNTATGVYADLVHIGP